MFLRGHTSHYACGFVYITHFDRDGLPLTLIFLKIIIIHQYKTQESKWSGLLFYSDPTLPIWTESSNFPQCTLQNVIKIAPEVSKLYVC